MIKSVYSRLFDQIVSMVNQNVSVPRRESELQTEEMPSIGLLDIYGFEAYPSGNSFEQLCINYANEKLQQQFNVHIFKLATELYATELPGEHIETIPFPDNQRCIDLLESRTDQSIFKIMEEELVMKNQNNEVLLAKFDERLPKNTNYKKSKFGGSKKFTIIHYAGNIVYNIDNFLQKNMDHASD